MVVKLSSNKRIIDYTNKKEEVKFMGLTCKQFGKMRSIMKRVDNQIEKSKSDKRERKHKKENK